MRRFIVAVALIAALGSAAVATAKSAIKPRVGTYVGKPTNANGVGTFRLAYEQIAGSKSIDVHSWGGVMKCADGSQRVYTSITSATLKGTKFSGSRKAGATTLKFSGKFTASTKMTGTLRFVSKGDTPDDQCDTGPVTFTAKYTKSASRAVAAKAKIKPKAGGYSGVITDKDGKGKISMVYATFVIGNKDTKAVQLFNWTGILKCSDGSTVDTTGNITSPLKGTKFSGRQSNGGRTLTFSGKWTSNTRISGNVRMKTTAPNKCDTGAITFKVKHT